MARMTIAEVTAEVLRKWCGSDAERSPPYPRRKLPLPLRYRGRARACADTWAPGGQAGGLDRPRFRGCIDEQPA